MNDVLATLLSIGMVILIFLGVFLLLVFSIVLYIFFRIRRHAKRYIQALNAVQTMPTPLSVFDGQYFTPDETKDLKAIIRERKESEARDSATLDTATRFHRDH